MPPKGDPTEFIKVTDQRSEILHRVPRKTIESEREIKQLVLDLLDLRLGAHVLDVGCGTGDDARESPGWSARPGESSE